MNTINYLQEQNDDTLFTIFQFLYDDSNFTDYLIESNRINIIENFIRNDNHNRNIFLLNFSERYNELQLELMNSYYHIFSSIDKQLETRTINFNNIITSIYIYTFIFRQFLRFLIKIKNKTTDGKKLL